MEEAYALLYQWINHDDYEKDRDKYKALYQEDLDNFNHKFDLIIEMYNYVTGNIKSDRRRIEHYFKVRNLHYCTLASLAMLMKMDNQYNDIPLFEQRVKHLSLSDRIGLFAEIINDEEAANIPKEELATEAGLINFLEASDLDAETKWEAIKILNNQETYYNEVAAILAEVIDLLKSKYENEINELTMGFYNYWSNVQRSNDILEILAERISWKISEAGSYLIPVIFFPFSLSIAMNAYESNNKDLIRFGIMLDRRFEFLFERSMTKGDIVEIGKLLSDKSKMDILELVSKRPCYGKELANALGLSTATISYHVNALLKAGFLQAEIISNKVYYRIDNEKISVYLEGIKKYFAGSNE